MKTLWILAAAATLAACHNRSEETGAAPERGDTTAVKSGYDTTQAAPTPAPADTGFKTDTTQAAPTPAPAPADTGVPTAPPPNPTYDTTSTTVPANPPTDTSTPSANPAPGAVTDTTMAPPSGNDATMKHDSSSTAPR